MLDAMTSELTPNRAALREQLAAPLALPAAVVAAYRQNGYVKLKQVLSPEVIAFYGSVISRKVVELNTDHTPLAERDTYGKAFLQIMNIWEQDETVREFSFSPRLARIAAELMGVAGVRLYHDQALYKEPGGGVTPWHVDQFYWPLSNSNTCTVWVPLQATPLALGPLAFSIGSQIFDKGRELPIGDDSEKQMAFKLKDFPVDETPFDLGEVSFHAGWTFHRASPNTSDRSRAVMTVIYIEDGIKLTAPRHKNHEADWARWMPGAQIGEAVATPLNPVLYRRSEAPR